MEAQRAAKKEDGVDQAVSDSQGAVGTVERLHLHALAWKQLRSLVHIAMASVHKSALNRAVLVCRARRRNAAVGRLLLCQQPVGRIVADLQRGSWERYKDAPRLRDL